MATLSPDFVKQGFWTDWSRGSVLGATITVNARLSNVVIAVSAVLVTLASGHLWNLILLVVHQSRATPRRRNALFRQQQILLRTLPPPGATSVELLKLAWHWRAHRTQNICRVFLPAMLAITYGLAALSATVFSSLVVSTANIAVLVESPYCGFINSTTNADADPSTLESLTTDLNSVGNYVRTCVYSEDRSPGCSVFVKPQVDVSTAESGCPFAKHICLNQSMGFTVDSQLLDVHDMLGINMKPSERVLFRKKTSCAPLKVDGFYDVENVGTIGLKDLVDYHESNKSAVFMRYGPNADAIQVLKELGLSSASNVTDWLYAPRRQRYDQLFGIRVINRYGRDSLPTYEPVPGLLQPDTDFSLVLIESNAVIYSEPVYDPIFRATRSRKLLSRQIYSPDLPFGPLGCLQQYQYCITTSNGSQSCSDLTSNSIDGLNKPLPHADNFQSAMMKLLQIAAFQFDLGTLSIPTDSKPLNASWSRNGVYLHSLPRNQWQIEVQTWESFLWAGIKTSISNFALGSAAKTGPYGSIPPSGDGEKRLCASVKMMAPDGFANVSVFGLFFILALALVFIVLDLALLRGFVPVRAFPAFLRPRINQWIHDGIYQLLRRVYEPRNEGSWIKVDKEIPVTSEICKLSIMPSNLVSTSLSIDGIPISMSDDERSRVTRVRLDEAKGRVTTEATFLSNSASSMQDSIDRSTTAQHAPATTSSLHDATISTQILESPVNGNPDPVQTSSDIIAAPAHDPPTAPFLNPLVLPAADAPVRHASDSQVHTSRRASASV